MKRLLLLLSMFLLAISAVNAALTADPTTINVGSGEHGQSIISTQTFSITSDIDTTVTLSPGILTRISGTETIPAGKVTFNIPSFSLLAGVPSNNIVTTIAIPNYQKQGTYSGEITATDSGSNAVTLAYSVIVQESATLDVLTYDDSNALTVSGEEGETKTSSFSIKNTGNIVLSITSTSFDETQLDLDDGDGDVIDLSFSPSTGSFPLTINPGETKAIDLTVDFVDNIDVDNYGGILTVASGSASDSFKLELNVQPEICSDGIVKDGNPSSKAQAWLEIDIKEPDNGEDFKPGETMNIEVKVKNNNDDDMDVVVEAFLYNVDQAEELETVESDSMEIKDGKSETFELELEIPTTDMDEDDTYILYVKAYEDGDEEENCNEDSVTIDIEKEKHDTIIDEFTVSPSLVECGDTARFSVKVENIGSKDESDVYVELKNPELGIDLRSNEFDLDSEDDYKVSFSFIVPKDTKSGSYDIESIVTFDDGDESSSEFKTLTVQCNGGETPSPASVDLNIDEASITSTENSFSVPVKVTNNEDSRRALTIELVNADWSEPVSPQLVTLDEGQSSTVYLYLKVKEGISGRQSATVNVKESGNVIASKTLNFDIEDKGFDFGSLTGNTTIFWVIGYLIVIIVLIYFVKLLFMPKRKI